MNREGRHGLICVAAGGLCGLGWLSSANATPPLGREWSSLSTIESLRSRSVSTRLFTHQEHTSAPQLDLRPPDDSPRTINRGAAAALAPEPFPSMIHHLDLGKADLHTEERNQLPGLGTVGPSFQTMSSAEIFARRVHREGLPVARLWESKSALVSIGLNQRGKPGLWLTQKIH
jgi:hypothetical protein